MSGADPSGAAETSLARALDLSGSEVANVDRVLKAVRSHLGMDVAFISEFADDQRIFRHIDAATNEASIKVGASTPRGESYCQRIVDGHLPELIPDTGAVPAASSLTVTDDLGIGSYLGVPIQLRDGSVYGTFCCYSSAPNHSLNDRDLRIMRAFAEIAAQQIDLELEAAREREDKAARIMSAIEQDELSIAYQPIYNLDDNLIAGFECLARFSALPLRSPDIWFAEAAEVDLGVQLEIAAIRKALAGLSKFGSHAFLGLNVSPSTVLTDDFALVLQGQPLGRIVLEVTEHALIGDYAELLRIVEPLRQKGLRLAVDDAGAGYASLRHILNLQPDVIKTDMSLTRGIDADPARQALASALISFAKGLGSQIVAEGVETPGELSMLRGLGIDRAQGYLLGKPIPLHDAVRLPFQTGQS